LFCIVFYNNIQAQCVGSQTASMSPVGPYSAGQVVTVTYTLSSFTQLNINWIIAFDIDYGVGWSSISPVSAPGNPGGSGGSWIWDTQNTYPSGLNFGPGYRFQNNGNANWGTSSTGPFTLSFQLVVGNSCTAEDLSIDLNVLGDCQTGGWNNGSCCTDPSYSVYTGNSIPINNNISILDNTSDISCYGSSDGSISLNISSGVSPFTYSWSNGFITASINNLSAGSYDVIVTDATGCSATLNNIIINEPLEIQISSNTSAISCYGSSDGSISLNITSGNSPFTYSWSNGATTASINNLSAGSYDVIVTDATGCSAALNNMIINEPLEIQISSNTSPISCYGFSDGSISLNITSGISPFTYSWSNGATTASINNLSAGPYDVIVTDATGCSTTLNIIINQASTLVYVLNTNDETCFGSSDGNASIDLQASPTPTGTVSLLSYCASNPAPGLTGQASTIIEEVILIGDNNDIYNNTSGISDFYEDYSTTMYADITEGLTYSLDISINDISGSGSYSGGVRVFIDFNIDGDFTDLGEDIGIVPTPANLGVMVPISFTVPNTGFYGATRMRVVCQDQYSIASSNDIGSCDSPTGSNMPYFGATEDYSIVLNNSNVNATFLWSTGQITDSIFGLSAGNYSVTITDDNGCLTIENFTISSATAITVLAAFDQLLCEGIFPNPLLALGSTAGNNYSWTPASDFVNATIQNPVFSNAISTTTSYMVTFTDFNGCVATDSVTITVFPTLTTDPINHN
jgi:uncharacterized protein (DUF2141 family)